MATISGTAREPGGQCVFRRIQNKTTVRQNMGRTLWWVATEKIL
jgi:hypothetical protein